MNKFTFTFFIFLIYGLAVVLVYNGVVRFVEDILNITWAWSLVLGLVMLITLLFVYKMRWLLK